MKNHYDNVYSNREFELRHPGDMLKDEIIFDLVKKFEGKNSNIRALDIGCGMGHTSLMLSGLTPQIIGLDTSIEGVKIAKERAKSGFIVSDSIRLPFQNGCFDLVLMKDILEHIEHDLQAIKEAYRVLKPDGLLILYVPYSLDEAISFESVVKGLSGYSIDDKVGHVRRYDIPRLKYLLNGFKIVDSFYFGHFLFGIMSIFGVLFYYDKNKKSKVRENEELKYSKKILLSFLLVPLKFIKVLGKAEYMMLRKFKGAGMFAVALKTPCA